MHLRRLAVTDFRSWEAAELDLTPGITVLVGPNGVGKTNLVEAAGYLATLGSHRVARRSANTARKLMKFDQPISASAASRRLVNWLMYRSA